jgi:hypothetical protein
VLLTEIGEVSTRKRHRIVRTQKRQGPQINLLRPDDTIEACSIWVIAHVCVYLIKREQYRQLAPNLKCPRRKPVGNIGLKGPF